jgi:putative transcriptional regulator
MKPPPQQLGSQLAGKCLIAMPRMGDPRFIRSVVYLCAHSAEGAMGLIVNKPAPDVRLGELLDHLGIPPGPGVPDIRVHIGGPVEHARGFVLHSADYESPRGTMKVDDAISMTATTDVLERIAAGTGPKQSLLALGYAGWGPGQLESEIAQNGWLTADAMSELVFGQANEYKWTAALRSIGVDPVTLSSQAGHA